MEEVPYKCHYDAYGQRIGEEQEAPIGNNTEILSDTSENKEINESTVSVSDENEDVDSGLFEFTSDYTKVPLVIEQEVLADFKTNWIKLSTQSNLLTISAGAALGSLTSKLGLGTTGSTILGGSSAITNSYSVENKFSYISVTKKLWYGKVTHNVFTGKITNINQTKIEKTTQNILMNVQQRVVNDFTGRVLSTSNHDFNKYIEIIHNTIPKTGMNINQW